MQLSGTLGVLQGQNTQELTARAPTAKLASIKVQREDEKNRYYNATLQVQMMNIIEFYEQ